MFEKMPSAACGPSADCSPAVCSAQQHNSKLAQRAREENSKSIFLFFLLRRRLSLFAKRQRFSRVPRRSSVHAHACPRSCLFHLHVCRLICRYLSLSHVPVNTGGGGARAAAFLFSRGAEGRLWMRVGGGGDGALLFFFFIFCVRRQAMTL